MYIVKHTCDNEHEHFYASSFSGAYLNCPDCPRDETKTPAFTAFDVHYDDTHHVTHLNDLDVLGARTLTNAISEHFLILLKAHVDFNLYTSRIFVYGTDNVVSEWIANPALRAKPFFQYVSSNDERVHELFIRK